MVGEYFMGTSVAYYVGIVTPSFTRLGEIFILQIMTPSGTLYVVATPIGNLADITLRALEILKSVAVIAAEDTRHSRRLLQHYGIRTPCIALYEDNEKQQSAAVLTRLRAGESVALISDAGTPLISDPGYTLITLLLEAGIAVVPIPGASACIAALSVSGLPSDRFVFEGFLPHKGRERTVRLEALSKEVRTMIFYESVHRIQVFIDALRAVFGGERQAVVMREMTKQFEECQRASLDALSVWLADTETVVKGEFVVIVSGATPVATEDAVFLPVLEPLLAALPLKQAVALTVTITGVSRKPVYQAALALKAQGEACDD